MVNFEMTAPPAGPRKRMRDLVEIGQIWEYRKIPNGRVRVIQVHRADKLAQVRHVEGDLMWLISFRDLKRYWRRVEDA